MVNNREKIILKLLPNFGYDLLHNFYVLQMDSALHKNLDFSKTALTLELREIEQF